MVTAINEVSAGGCGHTMTTPLSQVAFLCRAYLMEFGCLIRTPQKTALTALHDDHLTITANIT